MEDEVHKHSKKLFDTMKNSKSSLSKKVKEILIEIFIIVFAVTISIWLHGWDEHRHQQKEVKEFLADVKDDLNKDITDMNQEKDSLSLSVANKTNFLNMNDKLIDSLKSLNNNITINISMRLSLRKSNVGNYEGFKSSGKIGFIENKSLKKLILKYYQEDLPQLEDLEKFYNSVITKITDYLASQPDHEKMFFTVQFRQLLSFLIQSANNDLDEYDQIIKHAKDIVLEIDKESKN
jgi:hypothetical protein